MLKKFWNDESGQGMTEYIIIIALVAAVVVAVFRLFGEQIRDLFTRSKDKIATETRP